MYIKKDYYKGDAVAENQIKELTNQLVIIKDNKKIIEIVTLIRNIDSKSAFNAGYESGYRQGFQSSVVMQ